MTILRVTYVTMRELHAEIMWRSDVKTTVIFSRMFLFSFSSLD